MLKNASVGKFTALSISVGKVLLCTPTQAEAQQGGARRRPPSNDEVCVQETLKSATKSIGSIEIESATALSFWKRTYLVSIRAFPYYLKGMVEKIFQGVEPPDPYHPVFLHIAW